MMTAVHPYVEALLTGTRELPTTPHAWLNERRGAALERANALSVPTTRDEEWRFTDLTPLTRLQLRRVEKCPDIALAAAQPFFVPEAGARLVFVDGLFSPALSEVTAARIQCIPSGSRVLAPEASRGTAMVTMPVSLTPTSGCAGSLVHWPSCMSSSPCTL